ncbi:hypothetical protein KKA08_00430, partial [bacterium]|nr:hypothetical protein [bacterium]
MFKALIEILRKSDLLQEAYTLSVGMLKLDREMYIAAYKSLRSSDTGEMKLNIYEQDAKINAAQRDIRRKVLAHLVASPSRDIVFGLVLTSIIIDIERIGDYTKNIVELAEKHPLKLHGGSFEEDFLEIEKYVSERFDRLIEAFEKSDVELATMVMRRHREITQKCDHILNTLLSVDMGDQSCPDRLALGLYTRYLKRIASHLTNIASGIVNPFDRIGFK